MSSPAAAWRSIITAPSVLQAVYSVRGNTGCGARTSPNAAGTLHRLHTAHTWALSGDQVP